MVESAQHGRRVRRWPGVALLAGLTLAAGLSSAAYAADEPDATRSAAVRQAIIAERVAQRAEQLAKSADAANRAEGAAATSARARSLDEASKATRTTGEKLVQETMRRAAEQAVAAQRARAAAQGQGPAASTVVTTAANGVGAQPVPGAVVGAGFGQYGIWARYHTGIDFRAGHGTPVRAAYAGTVVYAGNSGDWAGNHVAVRHADGTTTMYSHLSSMGVDLGQAVATGQQLGTVGQTGRALGPHLHFEVYPSGVRFGDVYRAVNPQPWLQQHRITTN